MADGQCGVLPEQQHRQRLAYDHAAPHEGDPFALEPDTIVLQHLHHRTGRAGGIPRLVAGKDFRYIGIAHAVDVLDRVDDALDALLVDMFRHGPEDEDAVYGRVRVYLRKLVRKSLVVDVGGEGKHPASQTDPFATFDGAFFIRQVVRPFAYPYDAEAGRHAGFL